MASSRAAELLESLSGRSEDERPRWPAVGRRDPKLGTTDEDRDPDEARWGRAGVFGLRVAELVGGRVRGLRMPPILVLLALFALLIGWWMLAAPDPIEDRMRAVAATDVARIEDLLDASATSIPDGYVDGGTTDARSPGQGVGGSGADSSDELDGRWITVHVAGAVVSPGVIELPVDSRVDDAVAAAGGLRADADPDRMNLAAVLGDGSRILVPVVGQELDTDLVMPDGGTGPVDDRGFDSSGSSTGIQGGIGTVDVNTATADELESLPGVGPATAAAIIAKRESDGPFRSVDSLIEVRGIGQVKLEGIRDLVTAG